MWYFVPSGSGYEELAKILGEAALEDVSGEANWDVEEHLRNLESDVAPRAKGSKKPKIEGNWFVAATRVVSPKSVVAKPRLAPGLVGKEDLCDEAEASRSARHKPSIVPIACLFDGPITLMDPTSRHDAHERQKQHTRTKPQIY